MSRLSAPISARARAGPPVNRQDQPSRLRERRTIVIGKTPRRRVERNLFRTRPAEGRSRAKAQGQHPGAAERGHQTASAGRYARRTRPQLRCRHIHHTPRDTRRFSSRKWPLYSRRGVGVRAVEKTRSFAASRAGRPEDRATENVSESPMGAATTG